MVTFRLHWEARGRNSLLCLPKLFAQTKEMLRKIFISEMRLRRVANYLAVAFSQISSGKRNLPAPTLNSKISVDAGLSDSEEKKVGTIQAGKVTWSQEQRDGATFYHRPTPKIEPGTARLLLLR